MVRFKLATLAALLFASVGFAADPPVPPMAEPVAKPKAVDVLKAPGVPGGEIALVDRDQLRVGAGTKSLRLNRQMRAGLATSIPVPATFDWTKGHTIPFPMLGNDQWGDCFYVAACKIFIAANANATGTAVTFDQAAVIARYKKLSGGDNGLSDSQIFPEMKTGVVGPNGPHKILDYAVVSSTDLVALDLCQYAFGPTLFTFSVPSSVMNNIKPGVLWDTQKGNYVGGHAVILSEKKANGNYSLETWALNPPVEVTPRFMANNDPESIAVFTLEWFNKSGYAPNGFHYETLAPLWTSLTGGQLPASPFPPPVGPTPPIPPAPIPAGSIHFGLTDLTAEAAARLKAAGVTSFDVQLGFGLPPAPVPTPPAADPYVIGDYKAFLAHVQGGKKAYLSVGVADPYVNSFDWHCRVDTLTGFAAGVYLGYLDTGRVMLQRQPDPAPPGFRLFPQSQSANVPGVPSASTPATCSGPGCSAAQPTVSDAWYPGKLLGRPSPNR